ncbi:MAG: isocitrate lyase/PEP mutase family protein, partial [Planctomycetota bacterium]
MSMPRRLRELLAAPGIIPTFGAHDAFSARLLEQAGIPMLFLGGFGVAASSFGWPDVGLVTLSEMAETVRRVTNRLAIPLVADGDTGHGDLHNVARTVRDFEAAGAAGILLEDQVSPKRCGHFAGKDVVSRDEMLRKLEAALNARRDPDFVLFARTDARAIHGIDDAIARAQAYAAAGADVCFVEAPQSLDELARIPREIARPQLANMLTGGATPIQSTADLERLGYKIAVCPIETLLATGTVIRQLAAALLTTGRVDDAVAM